MLICGYSCRRGIGILAANGNIDPGALRPGSMQFYNAYCCGSDRLSRNRNSASINPSTSRPLPFARPEIGVISSPQWKRIRRLCSDTQALVGTLGGRRFGRVKLPALIAVAVYWWLPASAQGLDLTIDTSAARRVLQALQNPGLTRSEALAAAELPGNAAMIEKVRSFGKPASADLFADALIAAATSQPQPHRLFNFDRVRPSGTQNRTRAAAGA